jgi:hypothetical protein
VTDQEIKIPAAISAYLRSIQLDAITSRLEGVATPQVIASIREGAELQKQAALRAERLVRKVVSDYVKSATLEQLQAALGVAPGVEPPAATSMGATPPPATPQSVPDKPRAPENAPKMPAQPPARGTKGGGSKWSSEAERARDYRERKAQQAKGLETPTVTLGAPQVPPVAEPLPALETPVEPAQETTQPEARQAQPTASPTPVAPAPLSTFHERDQLPLHVRRRLEALKAASSSEPVNEPEPEPTVEVRQEPTIGRRNLANQIFRR